ncbi:hypothetical protein [Microbacterium sp.]|uniref:hypothetical protein n=1 Tax=Microbacterium sp. TaxID=51671 RepID=UPI00373577BD
MNFRPARAVRPLRALLAAVLVAALVWGGAPAALAANTRTISGVVHFDERTTPAQRERVDVSVRTEAGREVKKDEIAFDPADGTYAVGGLEPGVYRLTVSLRSEGSGSFYGSTRPTSGWKRDADTWVSSLRLDLTTSDVEQPVYFDEAGELVGVVVRTPETAVLPYRVIARDVDAGVEAEVGPWGESMGMALFGQTFRSGTRLSLRAEIPGRPTVYADGKSGTTDPKRGILLTAGVWSQREIILDLRELADAVPAPAITGSAKVGSTLTAKAGTWPEGWTLRYQWKASGMPISGATKPTFVPTATQHGKRITVTVTGSNRWSTVSKSSAQTAKVATGTLKAATPTISGTVAYGSTLTAKPGTWTSGTAFSYRWYADGKVIPGATKSTLKLTSSLKRSAITVHVTGKKAGYTTVTKASPRTAKVITAATPTIVGAAKVGRTLTAKAGAWTSGTHLTYRWYANGTAISGATKTTFRIAAAQKGKTITVKVTGKKSGYATATKTSKATKKVS